MKYMGSKNRFAKELLPIILKDRTKGQYYVEPFAGGMNLIDKVEGNRIANDIHTDLIEMWKALVSGWIPPLYVSEEDYKNAKSNKVKIDKALRGYIGFNSYGGKWFAGYRRDKQGKRDYWQEHYNNIMKQVPKLKGVKFENTSFTDLDIPESSIIYCDPPYEGTTKYNSKFDHILFWDWVRTKSKQGNKVYVSEYNAPSDFVCVWQKDAKSTFSANGVVGGTKKSTERLFIYCG
jgi:DNA adenine methylase